ncbi:MAG: hypothetical protein V3U97_00350 [bacterium]
MKKAAKERQKIKMGVVNKVINVLMANDLLTVADAGEILNTCEDIIKQRFHAMADLEFELPLNEALDHLKKPKILVPGANDIDHVKSTKIH